MKEDLESMVSGCRFEISRLEAAAAKQKGVMEEMRRRELDMQTILQKREADIKGAAIDVDTEREQRILREQSCQALKRELACTKEQLTTAEDMRSRAELRFKQSKAERDRLLLDLERQKQFASSKASQLGHLEHQHFQSESRVAELEKNVADLQRLLDQSKEKKAVENNFGLGGFGPAIFGIAFIALTGLLLWGFARNARRSELTHFNTPDKATSTPVVMPERAKALFAGIDLDLSKPAIEKPQVRSGPISDPLADTLRVKLNLARAYITIEDFSAAKKSLEEVLRVSNSVDPAMTIEAQGLLAELSKRNA
jgi:FimV-like protein